MRDTSSVSQNKMKGYSRAAEMTPLSGLGTITVKGIASEGYRTLERIECLVLVSGRHTGAVDSSRKRTRRGH